MLKKSTSIKKKTFSSLMVANSDKSELFRLKVMLKAKLKKNKTILLEFESVYTFVKQSLF